jgi:hypothetical protein
MTKSIRETTATRIRQALRLSANAPLAFLVICTASHPAMAGLLSAGICRPYKSLVDDDLYMVVAAIAAVGLLVAWKTMGGSSVLGKAVSLLAAVLVALNLENLLQLATGKGVFC